LVDRWLSGLDTDAVLRASGDDVWVRTLLSSQDARRIQRWAQGYDILFLDEAQRVPQGGWGLKIIIDSCPDLVVVVTGSASFALAGQVSEPLTGRQTPVALFPLSVSEVSPYDDELDRSVEDFLVFGMYPEVRTTTSDSERRDILSELASSYLFKDILELETVKHPKVLVDLLTLVALQIGSLVSVNELASTLGVDAKTVARYLDLLEKSFVLVNVRGFSRNLREEVTRTSKYYFYDTGVRNAILQNFSPVGRRADVGALWENFLVMERIKTRSYARREARSHFWRTWQQEEIDLIESVDGSLSAFEFKWNAKARARCPRRFADAYPDATFTAVSRDNWLEFVRGEDISM